MAHSGRRAGRTVIYFKAGSMSWLDFQEFAWEVTGPILALSLTVFLGVSMVVGVLSLVRRGFLSLIERRSSNNA